MQKEIGDTQRITWKQCGKCCKKKKPDDYVIATGKQYSVKQFINVTAKKLGISLKWEKKENFYLAKNKKNNNIIVKQDRKYFRAAEVDDLLGDSSKARKLLNWRPKRDFNKLIEEMIVEEMKFIN